MARDGCLRCRCLGGYRDITSPRLLDRLLPAKNSWKVLVTGLEPIILVLYAGKDDEASAAAAFVKRCRHLVSFTQDMDICRSQIAQHPG